MSFSDFPLSEFSRADEITAAHGRTFDTLALDTVVAPLVMADPQQQPPEGVADGGMFVVPGMVAGRFPLDQVMVEPVAFPQMDRIRSAFEPTVVAPVAAPVPPTAEELAQQVVAEARTTARTMLAQAREVIASERTQAVQQGYEEGLARGMAEADAETASLVATCEKIGVHVMEERERVLDENEADIVELAIAIARRIVNAAIDVDDTLVVEACRGAMRKAFQRGSMQVLAHPADLELLRAAGPELARELGGVEHLDFIEERRLDRGSVVVRTPAGEIDGTIAGKADKIEQSLREGIEQRRAERRGAA